MWKYKYVHDDVLDALRSIFILLNNDYNRAGDDIEEDLFKAIYDNDLEAIRRERDELRKWLEDDW